MKDVKIVIGANYGDEGKGLMTRHFCKDAKAKGMNPIVVFHNGTAQRGHTVDYNSTVRHVYHHFCSGTGDGVPTFFADTFLLHPMEYRHEYCDELLPLGIVPPRSYCDPNAIVITPFDMLVDHATEDHIIQQKGEREYGSCGFGSWCAVEGRLPLRRTVFTIADFTKIENIPFLMEQVWKDCLVVLANRGVDLEKSNFAYLLHNRKAVVENFTNDIKFFLNNIILISWNDLFKKFDSIIFENGQGLGLDVDVDNDWHTTSHTGIYNPYQMLAAQQNFNAEVCYVTRGYLTRHGVGPMETVAPRDEIAKDIVDLTNVHNDFQGSLKFGFLGMEDQNKRIEKDKAIYLGDNRFDMSIALTHINEFNDDKVSSAKYLSFNKFSVINAAAVA